MKRIIQLVALLLVIWMTGCASMGRYVTDRGRDAGDVFTATVGLGGGAKVRVGPAQLGTLYNIDMYGLRGGGFGAVPWYENHTREMLFPFPFSLFDSGMDIAGFGEERFCYQSRSTPALRGKGYIARVPFPLIGVANQPEYYTQFELFLGVFGTLRLGFNPGELLDFLLGWSTIDIYSDDLEKQKSKRRSQKSGTGAADPRP